MSDSLAEEIPYTDGACSGCLVVSGCGSGWMGCPVEMNEANLKITENYARITS